MGILSDKYLKSINLLLEEVVENEPTKEVNPIHQQNLSIVESLKTQISNIKNKKEELIRKSSSEMKNAYSRFQKYTPVNAMRDFVKGFLGVFKKNVKSSWEKKEELLSRSQVSARANQEEFYDFAFNTSMIIKQLIESIVIQDPKEKEEFERKMEKDAAEVKKSLNDDYDESTVNGKQSKSQEESFKTNSGFNMKDPTGSTPTQEPPVNPEDVKDAQDVNKDTLIKNQEQPINTKDTAANKSSFSGVDVKKQEELQQMQTHLKNNPNDTAVKTDIEKLSKETGLVPVKKRTIKPEVANAMKKTKKYKFPS